MVTTINYFYTFNKDFEIFNLKREVSAGPVTVTYNGTDGWGTFVVMLWDDYRLWLINLGAQYGVYCGGILVSNDGPTTEDIYNEMKLYSVAFVFTK